MINCKACNKEFEPLLFEKFCSIVCEYDYNSAINKIRHLKAKEQPPHFAFQILLKKKGWFNISQKTLDNIYSKREDTIEFEMLLASQRLMVVRLNEDMSVIKKSIL